jgi:hypothetical protein
METNSERRRRKLTDLCAQRGITKVAENAGLNWASLDQIIKKTLLPPKKDGTRSIKNLGDDAARKIERAEGLGEGWFDLDDETQTAPPEQAATRPSLVVNGIRLSSDAFMLAQMLDRMPESQGKFKAFAECMTAITKRLGSTEPTSEHALPDVGERSNEVSLDRPAERRNPATAGTDRRAR